MHHNLLGFRIYDIINKKSEKGIKSNMIDIETIKPEIIDRLKSLNLDKIILFGSYAYGKPTKDSDIDLFLVKDENEDNIEALALVKLRDLMKKYKIGFDVLSASNEFLIQREDPFYKIDILSKGKVIHGQ